MSEERTTVFMGSDNLVLPVLERVKLRLNELRVLGKPEFHKDDDKKWHNIEPKMPIEGTLEFADCVRKVSDEEYKIKYRTFKLNKDGQVVMIEIKAGIGDPGRLHKVVEYEVTETFKHRKPFTTEKTKLEDEERLKALAAKTPQYSEARDEKARGRK